MRIRLFTAFASNNSGSYALVGTFRSVEEASSLAEVLRAVLAAQDDWFERPFEERGDPAEAPFARFVREEGLGAWAPDAEEDWPAYGDAPTVLHAGHQVLVYAPYTVSLPRQLGACVYKRGGRVESETVHAHERFAAEFAWWLPYTYPPAPDRAERVAAMEAHLRELLPPLCAPRGEHSEERHAPAFFPGSHTPAFAALFESLPAGIAAASAALEERGFEHRLRVWECPPEVSDPLVHLRTAGPATGPWRVLLWALGGDPVRALKAVREGLQCDLRRVRDAVRELPTELLVDVSEAEGRRVVALLRDAGCDAECVLPARR